MVVLVASGVFLRPNGGPFLMGVLQEEERGSFSLPHSRQSCFRGTAPAALTHASVASWTLGADMGYLFFGRFYDHRDLKAFSEMGVSERRGNVDRIEQCPLKFTSTRNLLWGWGLCRCSEGRWGPSGPGCALLHRLLSLQAETTDIGRHTQRPARDDRDRDWNDSGTSQEMPRISGNPQKLKAVREDSPQVFRESMALPAPGLQTSGLHKYKMLNHPVWGAL